MKEAYLSVHNMFNKIRRNLIQKMFKAGMIEKTKEGYVLSLKFAEKLRKWAEEW